MSAYRQAPVRVGDGSVAEAGDWAVGGDYKADAALQRTIARLAGGDPDADLQAGPFIGGGMHPDQEEAERLADRVALIAEGRLEASGTPLEY